MPESWCNLANQTAETYQRAERAATKGRSPDTYSYPEKIAALESAISDFELTKTMFFQLASSAPDVIRRAFADVRSIQPETVVASERQRLAASTLAVEDYLATNCDVILSVADINSI